MFHVADSLYRMVNSAILSDECLPTPKELMEEYVSALESKLRQTKYAIKCWQDGIYPSDSEEHKAQAIRHCRNRAAKIRKTIKMVKASNV